MGLRRVQEHTTMVENFVKLEFYTSSSISGIMKQLITGTEVEKSRKKFTNHSSTKTLIKKLKTAGVAESSITKVTEHSTTGLKNNDPEDETEFQRLCPMLCKFLNLLSFQEVNNKPSSHNENVNLEVSGPWKKPVGNYKAIFNPFPS